MEVSQFMCFTNKMAASILLTASPEGKPGPGNVSLSPLGPPGSPVHPSVARGVEHPRLPPCGDWHFPRTSEPGRGTGEAALGKCGCVCQTKDNQTLSGRKDPCSKLIYAEL